MAADQKTGPRRKDPSPQNKCRAFDEEFSHRTRIAIDFPRFHNGAGALIPVDRAKSLFNVKGSWKPISVRPVPIIEPKCCVTGRLHLCHQDPAPSGMDGSRGHDDHITHAGCQFVEARLWFFSLKGVTELVRTHPRLKTGKDLRPWLRLHDGPHLKLTFLRRAQDPGKGIVGMDLNGKIIPAIQKLDEPGKLLRWFASLTPQFPLEG
jgi:hypothetical protein